MSESRTPTKSPITTYTKKIKADEEYLKSLSETRKTLLQNYTKVDVHLNNLSCVARGKDIEYFPSIACKYGKIPKKNVFNPETYEEFLEKMNQYSPLT